MKVVKPTDITETTLDSSSITEPDSSVGEVAWVAGTYTLGTRRIKTTTHKVYEVVADPSTTDDPEVGVGLTPPSWVEVGPTNKWAMFYNETSAQSQATTTLTIEVSPGMIINSIGGFGIEDVNSIDVVMTDPTEGVVYSTTIDMNAAPEASGWYYYFYSPISKDSQFILLDLPAYSQATLTITFNGGNIKVGNVIIGRQLLLGTANHGTNVQLLDYSRKEQDNFGNVVVTQGRTSKLVSFDVTIPRDKVRHVFNTLSKLTSVPCVWVGTDDTNDLTLVFGYYKDYQNNLSSPTLTDATLTIEGLTQ